MASFGAETSASVGYYKPKWHVEATLGFDKSITTHLKHSEEMKANYSSIVDGWFLPSGGNWFYGIQADSLLGLRVNQCTRNECRCFIAALLASGLGENLLSY